MRTLGLVLALVFGLGVLFGLAALLGAAEARHENEVEKARAAGL